MSYARPINRDLRRRDIAAAVGQVDFTFPAWLDDQADLAVFLIRGGVRERLLSGFTIALTPLNQATVTFTAAPRPLAGDLPVTVRLEGRRLPARTLDATRSGVMTAAALEAEFDRVAITEQELRRDADDWLAGLEDLRAVLAMILAGGAPASDVAVSRHKIRAALVSLGVDVHTQLDAVAPSDPNDLTAIYWFHADAIVEGDPAWIFIRDTLAWTQTQMQALRVRALQEPGPVSPEASETRVGRQKWRAALVASGVNLLTQLDLVAPADPNEMTAIYWFGADAIATGDPAWTFIKTTLGWSDAQMTDLRALALTQPG